jgi:hypothetical protein
MTAPFMVAPSNVERGSVLLKLALISALVSRSVNYNQRKIEAFSLALTQSLFAANITNWWRCETPGPKIASLARRNTPAQIL